jgi:hypothetical protein
MMEYEEYNDFVIYHLATHQILRGTEGAERTGLTIEYQRVSCDYHSSLFGRWINGDKQKYSGQSEKGLTFLNEIASGYEGALHTALVPGLGTGIGEDNIQVDDGPHELALCLLV